MKKSFLEYVIRDSWLVIRVFKFANHESRSTIHAFFFLIILSSFIPHPSSFLFAHTRLYACAIGSNAPGSLLGGSTLGAGLWVSDDSAATWKQLGWKHVKCYSVDVVKSSNGKIIYEACGNGVLRSTDAGANWKMLTDWRITEVMDLLIDQKSPKYIYISTPGAIWKSDDAGDNWYEADADMPQPIFVSQLKIDPENHLKIYAASESGIYESLNGGLSWKRRKGSGNAVKDLVLSNHGITAWIEENGKLCKYENLMWQYKNCDSDLWSMCKYHTSIITGSSNGLSLAGCTEKIVSSPRNIHTLCLIGSSLIFGSLDGGIWKYDLQSDSGICFELGLDDLQIWRIKTFDIK